MRRTPPPHASEMFRPPPSGLPRRAHSPERPKALRAKGNITPPLLESPTRFSGHLTGQEKNEMAAALDATLLRPPRGGERCILGDVVWQEKGGAGRRNRKGKRTAAREGAPNGARFGPGSEDPRRPSASRLSAAQPWRSLQGPRQRPFPAPSGWPSLRMEAWVRIPPLTGFVLGSASGTFSRSKWRGWSREGTRAGAAPPALLQAERLRRRGAEGRPSRGKSVFGSRA